MIRKKTGILIVIGLGAIILVGLAFWGQIDFKNPLSEIRNSQNLAEQEAFLTINDGITEPKTFKVKLEEGMTAFDLLQKKTQELNINLKTQNYDLGVFIEAIGDKENGTDGQYWLYYVNGEMPQVAADKQIIKTGDNVEFKFEKSPF